MMTIRSTLLPTCALLTAGMVAATTAMVGPTAARAEVADVGLVAEYVFAGGSGSTVPNTAPGSEVGAAEVINGASDDWTPAGLTLRGGPKDESGNWVRLPDDLLAGATSASITTEVRASPAMVENFHFLWNIGNEASATEYLFASLNCGSGRTPLVGIKSAGDEHLVGMDSCGVEPDVWTNVSAVIDGEDGSATLYIDGAEVATGDIPYRPADIADQSLSTIGRSPWPDSLFQGAVATFRVYDRALTADEVGAVADDDAALHADQIREQLADVLAGLDLTDLTTDTHIDLPTAGGRVSWSSSDPDVVSVDGTVNPPLAGESAESVVLTATAARRGIEVSESITVTVQPSSETPTDRLERLAAQFVLPPALTSGTAVPDAPEGTDVSVTAEQDGPVEITDGRIVTTAEDAATARLEAVVTEQATGAQTVRTFRVTVLPRDDAEQLLAYHRVPTSAGEANNADVALSMHLALATVGDWQPLNDNYGIFFASTAVNAPATGTSSDIVQIG